MPSLDKIKQRMKTIQSTSKITKAMELVATAKLKKAMDNFNNVSSYYNDLLLNVNEIIKNYNVSSNKFFTSQKGKTIWIVLTSDLGLCGGYNINNIRKLLEEHKLNDLLFIIGQKGKSICNSYDLKITKSLVQVINEFTFFNAQGIIGKVLRLFKEDEKITSIKLVASKFINNITFQQEITTLLPIKQQETNNKKLNRLKDFEPNQEEVIKTTIPIFLSLILYNKVLEANLIEQSSRRLAMESATNNAKDILEDLKIKYNRLRQANITQEISEIIAGTNI